MSRVTKFAAADPGPAARMAGFVGHLRDNGLRLGVAEAELAMAALSALNAVAPDECRRALRAVCTGCKDEAERFDDLFDSYWMDMGRVRQKVVPKPAATSLADIHSSSSTRVTDHALIEPLMDAYYDPDQLTADYRARLGAWIRSYRDRVRKDRPHPFGPRP